MEKRQKTSPNPTIADVLGYTYPRLQTGKEWYVIFKAFDPAQGIMRRKRIKLNHIEKVAERRRYAEVLMKRLINKLDKGWNPWIEAENGKAYHFFKDVCTHYRKYITKMFTDRIYREETYTSYISYIRNIENWNNTRKIKITYIYQFDKTFISEFLEYIYIDRDNSAQTRDNYLGFIRTFSSFLFQNQYVSIKPSDGIVSLGKKMHKKQRTIISDSDMIRIHNYLIEKNKYFLLACYVLHYCFIRPKEMSLIQLNHIDLKKQTIYIPENNSKNKKRGIITLPAKVIHLMLDLNIFNHPGQSFLFSENFKPGKDHQSDKQFRDFWTRHVRKDLKLPTTYKLYSLKDTGITSMLRKYDSLTVRDQARHADILMTDTYTPHDIQTANHLIINHEGVF